MNRLLYASLMAGSGTLGLSLVLLLPAPLRLDFYIYWGPSWALLCLLGLCAAALFYAASRLKEAAPAERQRFARDVLLSFVLSALICALVPARSLIENDENNLLGTAQAIHATFESASVGSGVFDREQQLIAESLKLDKRGVMFPLMLNALAPHFTSFEQARYWVNAFWGFLSLLLIIRIVRHFNYPNAAWAAAVLLASFPVFVVSMRSGLFDVANLALLLLVALMGLRGSETAADRNPVSAWLLLISAAVVVTQIRYEAALPVCIVLGLLMLRALWLPNGSRPLFLALAPLAFVPGLFRMAMPIDYEMPGPWFKPWTVMNIPDNLEQLIAWIWFPQGFETGNPIVGGIVLFGLLLWCMRRPWRWPASWPSLLLGLPLLALTGVLMYSYWGKAGMVITVRYFLYAAALLAVLASCVCAREASGTPRLKQIPLVIALVILAIRMPAGIAADPFTKLSLYRYRDAAVQTVNSAYADCNVLIISFNGAFFVNSGIGSIPAGQYLQQSDSLKQRAAELGLHAIAYSHELRSDDAPPVAILKRLGEPNLIAEHRSGHTRAMLYQIWPQQPVNNTKCERRPTFPASIRLDPQRPPRKPWETFTQRWSAGDPALRILMEPDAPKTAP